VIEAAWAPEGRETGLGDGDESPANREKNGEFRRFSRFPPKSISKTSAKSVVCKTDNKLEIRAAITGLLMPEGRVSPFVRRTPHGASLGDAQKQLNRVWVFTDLAVYGIPVCDAGVYGMSMIDESPLRIRYEAVRSSLDERSRRLSAAAEAKAAGYGGIAAASRATKVARSTIGRGLKDLRDPGSLTGKVRRKGGGSLG
jgi:hypothetical protein